MTAGSRTAETKPHKLATTWHDSAPETLKAYRIEPDPDNDTGAVRSPYILRGPRKAVFLVRNEVKPELLFSVNLENFTRSSKVAGYSWFTDADGTLKPVR